MSLVTRLSAAAVIAVATFSAFVATPVGAANFDITQACDSTLNRPVVTNGDTVTVTISGSACGFVTLIDQDSLGATATLNGASLPALTTRNVVAGDVAVITIPATGTGVVQLVSAGGKTVYIRVEAPATTTSSTTTTTVPEPEPSTPTFTG